MISICMRFALATLVSSNLLACGESDNGFGPPPEGFSLLGHWVYTATFSDEYHSCEVRDVDLEFFPHATNPEEVVGHLRLGRGSCEGVTADGTDTTYQFQYGFMTPPLGGAPYVRADSVVFIRTATRHSARVSAAGDVISGVLNGGPYINVALGREVYETGTWRAARSMP